MVTISESTRRTTYQPTTPTTVFPVGYPLFDNDDLRVTLDGEPFLSFTVSGTYINGIATDAAINVTGPGITGDVVIDGYRLPRRTDQYKTGAPLKVEDHNYSLNRVEVTLQELRRDTDNNTSRIDGMIDEVTDLTERAETAASNAEAANTAAQEAKEGSEQARDEAVAAAAGVNLPSITVGNAGETLVVKPDGSGYDLRTTTISVPTRTVLKALPVVFKSAYLTEAGREGTFISKAGSPPVSDTQEGVFVVSNTAGYYWERVYVGAASAKWFGAKGDGTTNDSTAVQAALDVTKNVVLPFSSAGYVIGGVEVPAGASIRGEHGNYIGAEAAVWGPQKTTVILPSGSSFAFRLSSFVIGTHIEIRTIRFNGAASSGTAVRLGMGSNIVFGVRLNDLSFMSCVEAIGDEFHATNWWHDVEVEDIHCYLTRGRQIYSRRSNGMMLFRSVKIDHTHNSSQISWEGARFEGVAGLEFDRFDVLGSGSATPTYNANAYSLVIIGEVATGLNASVWLQRVFIDTQCGPGIRVENIYNLVSADTTTGITLGQGITLVGVTKSRFNNTSIFGAGNGATPSMGFVMINCSKITLSNTYIENCKSHGFYYQNCAQITNTNMIVDGCTGRGVVEDGTSNYNKNIGLTTTNNTAGNLSQIAAQSATLNWTPNTGTFVASTVGPATV